MREIPESCADGIDEMLETATIIKEEVANAFEESVDNVERWFVKALSESVIDGRIDQLNRKVLVKSSFPRKFVCFCYTGESETLMHKAPCTFLARSIRLQDSREVCAMRLNVKRSGNLDLWLVAPTDDMHTKSIVDWSLEAALSFLWCQCTMVLHFGPRTWSSNGVGIMNMSLQDCFRGSPNERSEEIHLCGTGSVLFARALCLTLPIAVSMAMIGSKFAVV